MFVAFVHACMFANTIYYIPFEVKKFCGMQTKLYFDGKHSQLNGSLVWPKPILLEKFCSYVPINPQKPQNFSTSNNLQYMVVLIEQLWSGRKYWQITYPKGLVGKYL